MKLIKKFSILTAISSILCLSVAGFGCFSASSPSSPDSPSDISDRSLVPAPSPNPDADFSIAGNWLVVYDGTSRENWEIQVDNNQVFITAFNEQVPGVSLPGDYRQPLRVEAVSQTQQGIYLKVWPNESVVYEYQLSVVQPNRIEGAYKYVDTTLTDRGVIGGETGVITEAGRVIMTRM